MAQTWDKLTVSEAALVACVSVGDVNRLYDEKVLPEDLLFRAYVRHDHDRFVVAWACALISFYFESAARLTMAERLKAISDAAPRVNEALNDVIHIWDTNFPRKQRFELKDLKFEDSFLTIDWEPTVSKVAHRLHRLSCAKRIVETSPDVLSGAPVIAGTRVPVYDVAASVEKGIAIDRILDAYPSLNREQIELAAFYAKAAPPRGRPRKHDLPKGATIVADRRIPRRNTAR